jgi:hypothetical protein
MPQHESMKEFLRRQGLLVNRCLPNRRRALQHRLGELGFDVTRVVKRVTVVTVWEVNVRVDYVDQMPPPVGPFRARLRRALRALGYRCPERDIRIRLRGQKMKLTFPWPEQ